MKVFKDIFKNIIDRVYYVLDTWSIRKINVHLDTFILDRDNKIIHAKYRVGRQKLNNKLPISEVEKKYFSYLSGYDQLRITKFTTIQSLIKNVTLDGNTLLAIFEFVDKEIKDGELF